jgi:hypothetical protein
VPQLSAHPLARKQKRKEQNMKKMFIAVLTLLVIGFSISQSQLIRSYGVKAGIASTNQNWDWAPQSGVITNSTARQALDAGIFIEWLDIPLLSVVTEIHYIQKGSNVTTNIPITSRLSPDETGQFYSYSARINYLSIPLLAKIRMNLGLVMPYIFAGPRFDYYLSSSGTSLSSDFNKLDVGGTFGVGIELPSFLPIQVSAEARYSPNFQNSYSVQSVTVKNRSMEFLLVLSF